MNDNQPDIGMIVTRNCPTCGHHEIGYVDGNKTFHPLQPGDMVKVMKDGVMPEAPPAVQDNQPDPGNIPEEVLAELAVWIPAPVKFDKSLRLKYGVLVDQNMFAGEMSAGIYAIAYRQKVQHLLMEEKYTPLPIIFDRFFGVPYLATGSPLQMIEALIDEVDEISTPIQLVQDWLTRKDDASLQKLIHPKSLQETGEGDISDAQFKKEFMALSLEEFFELL